MINRFALIIGALILVITSSCAPDKSSTNAQRYELKGKVVSFEKEKHIITVAHEAIEDFMESMTMPFHVRDEWVFDTVAPGDQITATLVVDGADYWLENVIIAKVTVEPNARSASGGGEAQPGDTVPDFALVNQDNKAIRASQYRGKALLLTFIYTRCPIPDYCNLMSTNFAELDRELQKQPEFYDKTRLLSISIEPEHDTPAVLRSYGASHTGRYGDENFTHWQFATGTKDQINDIAKFFGLQYYPDKDQIIHGLRTAIVGPDGKVVKVYRGNDWKPADILLDLQPILR